MVLEFSGPVVYWRGPAPFYFVQVPASESEAIKSVAKLVSYGWGCIPCSATLREVACTTALFPKDGAYLLPLKVSVRRALDVDEGDVVAVKLTLTVSRGSG